MVNFGFNIFVNQSLSIRIYNCRGFLYNPIPTTFSLLISTIQSVPPQSLTIYPLLICRQFKLCSPCHPPPPPPHPTHNICPSAYETSRVFYTNSKQLRGGVSRRPGEEYSCCFPVFVGWSYSSKYIITANRKHYGFSVVPISLYTTYYYKFKPCLCHVHSRSVAHRTLCVVYGGV